MSSPNIGQAELPRRIDIAVKSQRPLLITGHPGVGKTWIIGEYAKANNMRFMPFHLGQMDPVDVRGFPLVNKTQKRTYWAPPSNLPFDDTPTILFFDELPQADEAQQKAAFQLINERRCGDYVVPDGTTILAAGNFVTSNAGSSIMLTAMRNRFSHVNIVSDYDAWVNWASAYGLDPMVIGFIRWRPQMLNIFSHMDTTNDEQEKTRLKSVLRNDNAFYTERTWHAASDNLQYAQSDDEVYMLVAGDVGKAAASEFMGYRAYYKSLPDIKNLIADPSSLDRDFIHEEPSRAYGILSGVISHLGREDNFKKDCTNALKIINQLSNEYRSAAFSTLQYMFPEIRKHAEFRSFVNETSNVFDLHG